ncbi:MAG: hypothetical protein DHS20C18_30820 [Saprospiraceae bacterium]|nr:MAG: hypothetical protein DHS20C18_30820 [Saprospiraceae bacterium]
MKYIIIAFAISFSFFSCITIPKTKVVKLEYYGKKCFEENLIRVYLNDSVFVEYTNVILSPEKISKRIDTFKIIDKKWYVKKCETFKMYFDPLSFERKDTIHLYDKNCRIVLNRIPQKKSFAKSNYLYEFKVEEQHFNYFAPIVWFDPEVGIVKIVSPTLPCEEKHLRVISEELLNKRALKRLYSKIKPFDGRSISP